MTELRTDSFASPYGILFRPELGLPYRKLCNWNELGGFPELVLRVP